MQFEPAPKEIGSSLSGTTGTTTVPCRFKAGTQETEPSAVMGGGGGGPWEAQPASKPSPAIRASRLTRVIIRLAQQIGDGGGRLVGGDLEPRHRPGPIAL